MEGLLISSDSAHQLPVRQPGPRVLQHLPHRVPHTEPRILPRTRPRADHPAARRNIHPHDAVDGAVLVVHADEVRARGHVLVRPAHPRHRANPATVSTITSLSAPKTSPGALTSGRGTRRESVRGVRQSGRTIDLPRPTRPSAPRSALSSRTRCTSPRRRSPASRSRAGRSG